MGLAGAELMLSDTNGSSRLSRSVRSRAPKRDLRARTEDCAQATLDLNRKALGLLMESIENTHQARIQAIRARQYFEHLLSISSRHCERVRSRKRAENEGIAHTIGETRDQHRRQANYERRVGSNVFIADERQDIKLSPALSIQFNTIGVTHQQHSPLPPANGHEFLGADSSGGCCTRSPPVRNWCPGTQGNRDHIPSKAMHAPRREEPRVE